MALDGSARRRKAEEAQATALVDLVDGVVRVRVVGEFDLATARTLDAALAEATAAGADVVVDLTDATFLDVGCLQLILSARRAVLEAGHRLTVEHPRPLVRRLVSAIHVEGLLGAR